MEIAARCRRDALFLQANALRVAVLENRQRLFACRVLDALWHDRVRDGCHVNGATVDTVVAVRPHSVDARESVGLRGRRTDPHEGLRVDGALRHGERRRLLGRRGLLPLADIEPRGEVRRRIRHGHVGSHLLLLVRLSRFLPFRS